MIVLHGRAGRVPPIQHMTMYKTIERMKSDVIQ